MEASAIRACRAIRAMFMMLGADVADLEDKIERNTSQVFFWIIFKGAELMKIEQFFCQAFDSGKKVRAAFLKLFIARGSINEVNFMHFLFSCNRF